MLALHWASKIAASLYKQGYEPSEIMSIAFATANNALLSSGLRVDGSAQLTPEGLEREAELLSRMTPDEIEAEYTTIKAALEIVA